MSFSIDKNFLENVAYRESGNRHDIANSLGYTGLFQMGYEALHDVASKEIVENGGYTSFISKFRKDRGMQEEIGQRWFGNIVKQIKDQGLDTYIGKPVIVGGEEVAPELTWEGAIMVAHLGGVKGLKKFLTRENYNPDDGSTRLSEYAAYGYLSSKTNLKASEISEIARVADISNDRSALKDFAAGKIKEADLVSYYSQEKFADLPGKAHSGPRYVYSKDIENMQKELNALAKANGLEPIDDDGRFGPRTASLMAKLGMKDQAAALLGVSSGDIGFDKALASVDDSYFIKANNAAGFMDNIASSSKAVDALLAARKIGKDMNKGGEELADNVQHTQKKIRQMTPA